MALTPSELKLAAHLLEMAADQYSNHGCNDFPEFASMMSLEYRNQFVKDFEEWNDPELAEENYHDNPVEQEREGNDYRMMDWMAMDFVAHKLKAAAGD